MSAPSQFIIDIWSRQIDPKTKLKKHEINGALKQLTALNAKFHILDILQKIKKKSLVNRDIGINGIYKRARETKLNNLIYCFN
jgi:hypothetical protein